MTSTHLTLLVGALRRSDMSDEGLALVLRRETLHRTWTCWCKIEHQAGDVRCQDCGDIEPGYHFRPVRKPWWWDNKAIRNASPRGSA